MSGTRTTADTAQLAARAVRSAAGEALGRDVDIAGPPELAVDGGWGSYVCRLAGDPPPWDGELVVRATVGPGSSNGVGAPIEVP